MADAPLVVTEGTLVGLCAGADGRSEVTAVRWRGHGFALRASAQMFKRAALFTQTPRAQLELSLPAGEWRLVFFRHDWSGVALIRDGMGASLHDLYRAPSTFGEFEVKVTSIGLDLPVVVELAAQRHPQSHDAQIWLLEARGPHGPFHPEAGRPVSATCRLIEGRYGQFLSLRTDTGVADELAATGVWEQDQIDLFARLVRPGEAVLDVGANIGHHTVALSKIVGEAGRVVAFEPQMQMFNLLNANIVLNRCRNVQPFRTAVGAREDKLKMYPVSYDSFLPFGSLGLQAQTNASASGETVNVEPLDTFLPKLDLGSSPISFVKVDVQAHELFVFQGAREFLRTAQPSISFEVAPYWMQQAGYDWREILSLLKDLGYNFFDDAGHRLANPDKNNEDHAEWQLLALSPKYRDRMA